MLIHFTELVTLQLQTLISNLKHSNGEHKYFMNQSIQRVIELIIHRVRSIYLQLNYYNNNKI